MVSFKKILIALFCYFAFLGLGAARQLIVADIGWQSYFLSRMVTLVLVVLLITNYFSANQAPNISRERGVYKNGDPLLLMRAVFCFVVLMQHGFGITFQAPLLKDYIWQDGLWLMLPSAWMGVWGFFVLSGYLMAKGFFLGVYPCNKEGLFGFYKNRIIKILPGYWLVLLVGSLILEPKVFEWENVWIFFSTALFDYDGAYPFGSLCSIATEMQFYVIAPFVSCFILQMKDRLSVKASFITIVCLFVFSLCYRLINFIKGGFFWKTAVMTSVLGNVDLFFGGMVLAFVVCNHKIKLRHFYAGIAFCLVFYLVGCYLTVSIFTGKDWLGLFGYFGPTVTGIVTLLAIYVVETSKDQSVNKYLVKFIKHAGFVGALTYEIYLLHDPIQRIIRMLMPEGSEPLLYIVMFGMSVLVTYLSAFFMAKYFSQRFEQYRYISKV